MKLTVGQQFITIEGSEYRIDEVHQDYFKYSFRSDSKSAWYKDDSFVKILTLEQVIKQGKILLGTDAAKVLYGV